MQLRLRMIGGVTFPTLAEVRGGTPRARENEARGCNRSAASVAANSATFDALPPWLLTAVAMRPSACVALRRLADSLGVLERRW